MLEKKFLIIDKLSIVSSDLWADIDSKLQELFTVIPEKAFTGLGMKHRFGLKLWHLFKYAEWTHNVDDGVEKILKARFIHKSDFNLLRIKCKQTQEVEQSCLSQKLVQKDC